ncbi:hypothetical protein BJX61DRAFT_521528 [Aspergillus egyptiacus]|nr:hypothetical protein BJX61DRAFT_521528 [Aspergillus egyptiacus]
MAQRSGFPTIVPAYIIKFEVGEGQPVGVTSSGSTFVHYSSPGGTISSVDGFSPAIEANIAFAGDWLYFDPDQQHTRMNVKGVARTTDGEGINFAYSGVSTVSPDLAGIFHGQPKTIPFGQSTLNLTFEVGDARIKDLENSVWVGNGRFLFEDNKLWVEVRVSKVVASEDMD